METHYLHPEHMIAYTLLSPTLGEGEKDPVRHETVTATLKREIVRALEALERYEASPGDETWASQTHAALHRASMDLSRALVAWRGKRASDRESGKVK